MIGGLVPGFKGAGHPDQANRHEDCRRARKEQCRHDEEYVEEARDPWRRVEEHPAVEEVRDAGPGEVPDAAGEGDPRIRRPYTPEEEAEMGSIRSAQYPGDDPGHHHCVQGARDAWEAAERLGSSRL